jgi:hypothetical protein
MCAAPTSAYHTPVIVTVGEMVPPSADANSSRSAFAKLLGTRQPWWGYGPAAWETNETCAGSGVADREFIRPHDRGARRRWGSDWVDEVPITAWGLLGAVAFRVREQGPAGT